MDGRTDTGQQVITSAQLELSAHKLSLKVSYGYKLKFKKIMVIEIIYIVNSIIFDIVHIHDRTYDIYLILVYTEMSYIFTTCD